MTSTLFKYKFEIFLTTQVAILFGSLFVSELLFEEILAPFFFFLNVIAGGILLISDNRTKLRVGAVLLMVMAIALSYIIDRVMSVSIDYIRLGIMFLFTCAVTFKIIKSVWKARVVNKNVIFGLMSGYISLGLIAFFIFLIIELANPGSFKGNLIQESPVNQLMYYSYISMMTIGFGDIVPNSVLAQKATIFVGLMGQFYLVIISAVVIGKFLKN